MHKVPKIKWPRNWYPTFSRFQAIAGSKRRLKKKPLFEYAVLDGWESSRTQHGLFARARGSTEQDIACSYSASLFSALYRDDEDELLDAASQEDAESFFHQFMTLRAYLRSNYGRARRYAILFERNQLLARSLRTQETRYARRVTALPLLHVLRNRRLRGRLLARGKATFFGLLCL